MPDEEFRYAAFISYRHEPVGRKWAIWLHRAIENYRVPKALQKIRGCPARLGRVFRDEEELSASADLSVEIDKALVESRFLIVVCTPRTPHSRWVNQEIRRFRELGRGDRILALLVEGDPRESFPPALVEIRRTAVESDACSDNPVDEIEPLAADVRQDIHLSSGHGRGHTRSLAQLRILAALLGVRFDDLRNRDQKRTQGRILAAAVAALALSVLFGALGAYAVAMRSAEMQQRALAENLLVSEREQRAEAERQRAEAETQRAEAERQSVDAERQARAAHAAQNFLADCFRMARLTDAGDKPVTAIDLARGGAARIDAAFHDDPDTARSLREVFAEILYMLGRPRDAFALLCVEAPVDRLTAISGMPEIRKRVTMAQCLMQMGRTEEAEPLLGELVQFSARNGDGRTSTFLATSYAAILRGRSRATEAESLLRPLVLSTDAASEPDAAFVQRARIVYAGVLDDVGLHPEALQLLDLLQKQSVIEPERFNVPPYSPVGELARLLAVAGRATEAEDLLRNALDQHSIKYGVSHPYTLSVRYALAQLIAMVGRDAEADQIASALAADRLRVLGDQSAETIDAFDLHALILLRLRRVDEAIRAHEEADRMRRANGVNESSLHRIQEAFDARLALARAGRISGEEPGGARSLPDGWVRRQDVSKLIPASDQESIRQGIRRITAAP